MIDKVTFTWLKGQTGVVWLVQPRSDNLPSKPPFIPSPETCAWPTLRRAFERDAAEGTKGPVAFVVPELSVHPDRARDVIDAIRALPDNRIAVVGLGHLTRDQCEDIERNTGHRNDFWLGPWTPSVYANAALIATKHQVFLQPKGLPSYAEHSAQCFLGGSTLRVFEGTSDNGTPLRLAVTICSEWLEDGNPDSLARQVEEASPDIIFWIQHNRKPRSDKFHERLLALFKNSRPLIVVANCAPVAGRLEYGASGFLFCDLALLPTSKHRVCFNSDSSTEAVVAGRYVVRMVLPRYDVDAHRVETVLPGHFALSGDTEATRGRFISRVLPYSLRGETLDPDDLPGKHVKDLLELGMPDARAQSGLSDAMLSQASARLDKLVTALRKANQLMVFLDHALVQNDGAKHAHCDDHPVAASCCHCWDHRNNIDSLFDTSKDSPAKAAELVLALAYLDGEVSFERKIRNPANILVQGKRLLLAVHHGSSAAFEQAYFKEQEPLRKRPAIVLRTQRSGRIRLFDAAHIAPLGEGDQANAMPPEPIRLYGQEFWDAAARGSVLEDLGVAKVN